MRDDKISKVLGVRSLIEIKEGKVDEEFNRSTNKSLQDDDVEYNERNGKTDHASDLYAGQAMAEDEGHVLNSSANELAIRGQEGDKQTQLAEITEDQTSKDNLKDIDQARCNIKNIIEQGDDALKEMIELAKQSESPRAFEVAATVMKTLLDANKDFVEMSTKKKYAIEEINGPKEAAQSNVTNNNLIVSTADLLKMIKGEKDG